ncbi:MAG: PLDc N-terminal domain-containing protein [Propionibacteriaceae bacterium]
MLFLFWTYLFVAYLMVMFQIIGDLFRDRDLSGGVKAVWFIGLIILPIITAVIYLIVRGKGMAERQLQRVARAQGETEQYIQSVASRTDPAHQITSAKSLLDAGTINQSEFDQLKAKALAA